MPPSAFPSPAVTQHRAAARPLCGERASRRPCGRAAGRPGGRATERLFIWLAPSLPAAAAADSASFSLFCFFFRAGSFSCSFSSFPRQTPFASCVCFITAYGAATLRGDARCAPCFSNGPVVASGPPLRGPPSRPQGFRALPPPRRRNPDRWTCARSAACPGMQGLPATTGNSMLLCVVGLFWRLAPALGRLRARAHPLTRLSRRSRWAGPAQRCPLCLSSLTIVASALLLRC